MNVLGLDTATAATAVCLLRADGRAFEVVPSPARLATAPAHAAELLPAVRHVLDEGEVSFADLDALAVGVGPGTFTGLRIGIATARAIASARSLTVHPVSSLAALAAGARAGTDVDTGRATRAGADPVLAVVDARRGEVYAALDEPGAVRPEPFVAAPRALAERIAGLERSPLTVGDGAVRFRAELQAAGARVAPEDSPLHVIRALHVCRLASEVPAAAPEAVVPEYLRSPDAAPPPPLASP